MPVTADGQAALAACAGFGLEVRLHDDDGGDDRELRLSAFAGPGWDDPATWACVLLRRPGVEPGGRALAAPLPPEPLARVGFHPDWDTAPYHLTPDRYGGAKVHLVEVDDCVRSPAALRVERSERCSGASRLVAIELPNALAGPLTASVWARGDARIGLRLHGTVGGALTLEPQWRRFVLPVAEPHPAELWLEADGPGWVEVAEIALERPRQPPGEPVRVARRP